MQYNNTNKKEDKNKVKDNILTQYLINNLTLLSQPISLDELSIYVGLKKEVIVKRLNRVSAGLINFHSGEGIRDTLNSMAEGIYRELWSDRLRLQAQTAGLLKAQGPEGYKPFISSAANQALKNQTDQMGHMLNYMKLLSGFISGPTTSITFNTNSNNTTNNTKNENYLTIESAQKMLESEHKGLNLHPTHTLPIHDILADCPEVIATNQQGYKPDGTMVQGHKPVKPNNHENRRSQELGADEDESFLAND